MAEYLQEDDGQITLVLACELFLRGWPSKIEFFGNLTAFRTTQCHFLPPQEIRPGLTNGMIILPETNSSPLKMIAFQ